MLEQVPQPPGEFRRRHGRAGQVALTGAVIPGARLALRDGRGTGWLGRDVYLDITRLREDTGFGPGYDTTAAVADYIGWLRAGNER